LVVTAEAERLLDALLKLPRTDRVELFDQLAASLGVERDEIVSAAWREEILGRIARVDAGEAVLVDADDIERELLDEQDSDERHASSPGR
jgi:hypothetical protein